MGVSKMENKNTRGIGKIMVGITIMFFSLFFSLLVDSNRIEAAGVHQLSECSNRTLVVGSCSGSSGSFVSIKIPYSSYKTEDTLKKVNNTIFLSDHTFAVNGAVDGDIEVYIKRKGMYDEIDENRHVALFKEGKQDYNLTNDSVRIYSSSYFEEINKTINFNDSDLGDGVYYLIYWNEYANNEVMYKLSVDLTPPTVSFSPHYNSTFKKSHIVTVTVNDNIGVDHNYLKYAWSTSSTFPTSLTSSSLTKNTDTKGTRSITTPTGISGVYYLHIEARDSNGNKTRSSTGVFYLDNDKPTITSISLRDAQTGMNYSQGTWTNHNVKVEFYCSDSKSGMKKCDLYNGSTLLKSFTSGGYHILTSDINSSSIRIKMEDNAGNVSYSSYMTIKIDKTKPTASLTLFYEDYGGSYYDGEWTNRDVYAHYVCSSNMSNIKYCGIYYKDPDGLFYELWGYNDIDRLEGAFGYTFKNNINSDYIFVAAEDYAGNVTFSEHKTIRIDKTKPTASLTLFYEDYGGSYYDGEWTNRDVYAHYVCSSNMSNIKYCGIYYKDPDGLFYELWGYNDIDRLEGAFGYTFKNNINSDYIFVAAEDYAGNVTFSEHKTIRIDKTAPTAELNLKYSNSNGNSYDGTWTNHNVKVEFSCSDSKSGMKMCDLYNDNTLLQSLTSGGLYIFTSEINSDRIFVKAEDMAGNETTSEYKIIRIDKTIKRVQFDTSVTDGLTFGINGLGPNRAPLDLVTISINGNPVKLWSTAYPGANSMEIMKFDYYGVYNIEITTKDKAGNKGTYKHQVTYENPNSMVDEIEVSYGPGGNRSHLSPIISEGMSVVIIRNDGENNSKIKRPSANSLYSGFFGDSALGGANIQNIGYSINDGENEFLSHLTDDIRIPPIDVDSPSCVNDEDYLTCAKIDILTLFIEYTIDGDANTPHMTSTLKSQQTITLISLDVRPVDVSAGSGTQSMNLNVGQVYEVEPLSFDSQIGNEIVSIDETIEFNGEVVDSIDTNKIGTYTITTIATDSEGFKSLPVVRTIVIKDSIPPTISLIGEQTITIKKGQTYVDEGSLAIDNVDGEITVYGSGEVNYNKAGTYEITYQYIDSNGNVSEVLTRTIIVKPDYAKYVILALSSITVLGIAFILIKKFNVKTSY